MDVLQLILVRDGLSSPDVSNEILGTLPIEDPSTEDPGPLYQGEKNFPRSCMSRKKRSATGN
jgi:hypothetical protein